MNKHSPPVENTATLMCQQRDVYVRRSLHLCQTCRCLLQPYDKLWLVIADKVTLAVQQIIEFAKMVPGFMNLLQDDQIMLLKGGGCDSNARCVYDTAVVGSRPDLLQVARL